MPNIFIFFVFLILYSNKTEYATENHVDELKVQIMARDKTIDKLERELKKKTEQYHGVLHDISHSGEMVDSVRCEIFLLQTFNLEYLLISYDVKIVGVTTSHI